MRKESNRNEPSRRLKPYGSGGKQLILWQHSTQISHPPKTLTLSHVTAVQEGLQLEKVNRWLGPRTKWSPFSKSTCGIWEGNGFAAKQSIMCNYNNLTSENGLFHFIRRVALSCLIVWTWWGGAGTVTGDYSKWDRQMEPCLNAPWFLSFTGTECFFNQKEFQHLK